MHDYSGRFYVKTTKYQEGKHVNLDEDAMSKQ